VTAPLHPRGTLRARFTDKRASDVFRRLGVAPARSIVAEVGT